MVVLLLVACRREPQRAERPAIGLAPADASVDAEDVDDAGVEDAAVGPDDADCKRGTAYPITSRGRRGTAELVTCKLGDRSDNDEARDQGFVYQEMQAWLVLTPEKGSEERIEWATWTDGWEWSSSHTLAGVLVAPSGEGVIVEDHARYGAGPGIGAHAEDAIVWKEGADAWKPIATEEAALLTVTVSADGQSARVEGCVRVDDPTKADSCGRYDDGATRAPVQLRYTGTKVVRRRVD